MQRAPIDAALEFLVGFLGLLHRQSFRERDNAQKFRSVLLQSTQVHLREFDGGDFLRTKQFSQLWYRRKGEVFD